MEQSFTENLEQNFTRNAVVIMVRLKKIVEKKGSDFVETDKNKLELTVLKNSTNITNGTFEVVTTENEFSDNVIVDEKLLEKFKVGDRISYLSNVREYKDKDGKVKSLKKIIRLLLADGKTWLNGKPSPQDLPF